MEPGATASVRVIEFRVADQAAGRRDNFNFLISNVWRKNCTIWSGL